MKIAAIIGGNKLAEYLSIELKNKKYKVYHLTRRFYKNKSFNKTIEIKSYNFRNLKKNLETVKPDLIINLVSYTKKNLIKSMKINTILPINLLKWSIENNIYLVLIGTAAEYGLVNKKKVSETNSLKPNSVYGFTKSLQSLAISKFYKLYKNRILLFRIFNLSGDISNQNTIIGKVNNFIEKNKKTKKMKILKLGDLSSMRDYINIEKAANLMVRLIKKNKYGIFNMGTGKATLVRKMVSRLFVKYKKLSFVELNNKFHINEILYSSADIKKIKKNLL